MEASKKIKIFLEKITVRNIKGTDKMKTNLYTVLIDWNGGTYISQVAAPDLALAISEWSSRPNLYNKFSVSDFTFSEFAKFLMADDFVELEGLRSIWCGSGLLGSVLAIVNIILTVDVGE